MDGATVDGSQGLAFDAFDDADATLLRSRFPILSKKVYLNSNSLGALSTRAMEERRRFEELWNEMGAAAWYEIWLAKLAEVRAAFGATICAAAENVALMPSVSGALAAVWSAVSAHSRGSRRTKVVTTELDFPTIGHHFLSQQPAGYQVEIVRSPDGIHVPLESIREAVDERTALLATSHVFYASGTIQNAAELAAIARERGAFIFLDAYQSNGQMAIDVGRLGPHFLAGGALKWLCGGPGMAYLYVDPEVRLPPATLSWFGVKNQFDFDIRDAEPREDARRFEMGTPAAGVAYTVAGGLSTILEVGMEAIERRNRRLADDLRGRLAGLGYALRQPACRAARSALVVIEHEEARRAVGELAKRDVIVDHRGKLLRLSPHFYNSIEDNERAVAALSMV